MSGPLEKDPHAWQKLPALKKTIPFKKERDFFDGSVYYSASI
jgi:hypothetical protein